MGTINLIPNNLISFMPDLTLAQIFGTDVETDIIGDRFGNSIYVVLDNFENYDPNPDTESGGEILGGIGINDMVAFGNSVENDESSAATKILYSILLITNKIKQQTSMKTQNKRYS